MRIFTLVAVGIVTAGVMVGPSNYACAQILITCAEEGQTCYLPFPWLTVSYGKSGGLATRSGVSSVQCADSTSGFDRDPLVGQPKTCTFVWRDASTVFKRCALEGQTCEITSNKLVRFGDANTNVWVYGSFGLPFACTRSVFGDPIVSTPKECQVMEY